MARRNSNYSGRRLYPNGWPDNMRAVLYLNKKRRDANPAFNPGQPLQTTTMIYGTTEMGNYG